MSAGPVTLTIERLGAQGDGIATHDGRQVFAPLTLPEDTAEHPWANPEIIGRRPGAISRWSTELKATLLISPMLVCTVGYEHMEGTRFRHTAQFRRWRPDREPASCGFDQLEEVVSYDLAEILGLS